MRCLRYNNHRAGDLNVIVQIPIGFLYLRKNLVVDFYCVPCFSIECLYGGFILVLQNFQINFFVTVDLSLFILIKVLVHVKKINLDRLTRNHSGQCG